MAFNSGLDSRMEFDSMWKKSIISACGLILMTYRTAFAASEYETGDKAPASSTSRTFFLDVLGDRVVSANPGRLRREGSTRRP